MSNCIICGMFASTPPYCQLCSMGKIGDAENKKIFKQTQANKHYIPGPDVFPRHWHAAVELRVAELFKTKGGIPGHWEQIQMEVNRTRSSLMMVRNDLATEMGKKIYRRLGYSIISSAKDANFDFSEKTLQFPGQFNWLTISKKNMTLTENWS